MARSSQHCYFSNQLLDHYLSQDLIRLKQGCQLSVDGLKSMPSIKQHPLLRAWLIEQDCPLPDTHQLNTMMTDVVYAKRDAIPCVKWKGYELRRYSDLLYVMPKLMCFDRDIEYVWNLQEDLTIKPLGLTLQAKSQAVRDIQQIYQISQVTVRFRQGGERLPLRGYHQTLSKYFQQARIPPWLRDRMPLLFMGDELIFVWLEDWELSLS